MNNYAINFYKEVKNKTLNLNLKKTLNKEYLKCLHIKKSERTHFQNKFLLSKTTNLLINYNNE
jgi:hypothetical protein